RPTSTKAAPTSTVENNPQPASSTCGQSAFQVTDRSIAPKPGGTSQLAANNPASTRTATPRIATPCPIQQDAAAPSTVSSRARREGARSGSALGISRGWVARVTAQPNPGDACLGERLLLHRVELG